MDCFWEHNALHCEKPKQRLLCWCMGVNVMDYKRAPRLLVGARVLRPSSGLGIPQAVKSAIDPLTQRSPDETRESTWTLRI